MKLIEALIVAQQEYGVYGDWKAIHGGTGCFLGRAPRGVYLALDLTLISQSDRLETVIADFAGRYPDAVLDEEWKVSRWEQEGSTVSFAPGDLVEIEATGIVESVSSSGCVVRVHGELVAMGWIGLKKVGN